MANVPVPLDFYAIASDETQLYRVNLITNDPDEGVYLDSSGVTVPADPEYAPQDTYGSIESQDTDHIRLALNPVLFSGDKYAAPVVVRGYQIAAVFDNGLIPMSVEQFDVPFALGPGSGDINIQANIEVLGVPSDLLLNWG